MTSKAEKRRRKVAERKKAPYLPPFAVGQEIRKAAADKRRDRERTREQQEREHRFSRTPKQEEAEAWFFRLMDTEGPEATDQIRAVRAELTMEEFAVLAEDVRLAADGRRKARTAHRINHTSTHTHDLRMSALRKLVIYRSLNDLDQAA